MQISIFGKTFGKPRVDAATATDQLPPAQPLQPTVMPKVKSGVQSHPAWLTTAKPTGAPLPQTDRRLASTDVTTLRAGVNTWAVVKNFVAASPDLSAAVFAYLRLAITANHTCYAVNPDGTFNPEATTLINQVITRMDVMPGYDQGFSSRLSLRSLSEQLGKELLITGGMMAELVLDKTRLPSYVQPISVTQIKWLGDPKEGMFPRQIVAGQNIDLDFPTIFYTALDQDMVDAYSSSPLESAVKAVLFSEQFVADVNRVMKKAIHPRQHVKLDYDKFLKVMPSETLHDAEALKTFMNGVVSDIEGKVNGLNPEDALVYWDFMVVERETNGNISLANEYTAIGDMANAKLSTGAKTMPAILGHGVASSNIASAETLLFMKSASGAVQEKLNEMYSRMFTLAARLFGFDVICVFKYDPIDLRPDAELEAFKVQKQGRILEQLSLGLITDEEAALALTGKLPPAGYKPLSGTMFQQAKAVPDANPTGATNGGSATNKALNSGKPGTDGGKKAEVFDFPITTEIRQ